MNIPKIKRPGKRRYHFEDMEKGFWKTVENENEATSAYNAAWKRGYKIIIRTISENKINLYFMGKKNA